MKFWVPLHLLLAATLLAGQDAPKPEKTTKVEEKTGSLEKAVESVESKNIRKYLTHLASDELEGRLAGYSGNDKAAEFIVKHCKEIGLKPLGDEDEDGNRTYLQEFSHSRGLTTNNIIGYVEGTDPDLKHEAVLVGAHMDHVGKSGQRGPGKIGRSKGDDDIWNGADDNGSGTTTLMEVARAFMAGEIRTKRSVIFMWFSAEEWGLLGSAHYVEHTYDEFPIADHVAMINLDMVGRNPDKPCSVSGTGTWDEWETLLEKADEGIGADLRFSSAVGSGSDHVSFARKSVPSLHFFTGFHANYHRVGDHVDKIDFDRAAKIAKTVLRLATFVANHPERPEYKGRKVIGINGEAVGDGAAKDLGLKAGEGGFEVTSVSNGSVAEKAGLEVGDVIVSFDGKTMPRNGTLEALRSAIQKAERNAAVPFVVIRDGEKRKLVAVWGRIRKKSEPKGEEKKKTEEKKGPSEY